ncbi:DUF1349 domain-containing protein [Aeromonas jandaei]|uniref:DUF1349 domain-containing protein n=1 Tax=Aeromonas jandaei TaxID=650 RepID=UPI0019321281|nr:DUF1349 domain-containing protein [Aeromonas jandaei]MBM0491924.1 DUF1349 domain-containing protein [Aeromonas jandaei]MBM0568692.1 DUF1349 domain-containing protein [Aeromonas jandaei]
MMEVTAWRWLNEPAQWHQTDDGLQVVTDQQTDFWRSTWYGFERHSGHVYGCEVTGEFTFQVCVEGEFTTLYDQAGLMLLQDDAHWLKAGIEYNDDQPMIGSVLTNPRSDWATGIFSGNPRRFWLRLTRLADCLRLQYSTDGKVWPLLRLAPFPPGESCFIGVMCCTPERQGLAVRFSDLRLTAPLGKALHDLG